MVNEDATGSITALQAEIKRLREELEKARGETQLTVYTQLKEKYKFSQPYPAIVYMHKKSFRLCHEFSQLPLTAYVCNIATNQ